MKGLALNTMARGLVILFQLINVKLYTNYLDASQLGVYFFLLSVSYSANALLFIPLDYYQQANLFRIRQATGGLQPILILNQKMSALYAGCSLLIFLVCCVIWPDHTVNIILIILLAYALYAVQALRNTLNNLEYRNYVSISFIQEAVMKVIFFYLMVKVLNADASLMLIAWLASLVLTGGYLVWKAYRSNLFTGDSKALKINGHEVFLFSRPFSIGAVCNWLQMQGYRMVLVPLGFAEEVGLFATLSSIGSAAIGAVSLIYGQQFTPMIYRTKGKYTSQYLRGALAVVITVGIIMIGLGEQMIRMLTSPEFTQFWDLILFGVITDGAVLLIGALAIHISLVGNTRQIISPAFSGLISMVVCFGILYCMGKVSLMTIGIPLLISQWIVVGHMYYIYKKL
jgi:O-antigen/teichoic acid export membrane protein